MKTSIEEFWAIYDKEAKKAGMNAGTYLIMPKLIRIADKPDQYGYQNSICPVCFVADTIRPDRPHVEDKLGWDYAAIEIGLDMEFAKQIVDSADNYNSIWRERLLEPLK